MPEDSDRGFIHALRGDYAALFSKQWPAWIGGLLLALINILLFAYEKPWSAADGVRSWGNWVFNSLGITDITIIPPYLYSTSLLNFGVIAGAFAAALLIRQFRIQGAPAFEIFKAVIGGSLMGIGAAMAFGCNIGGFFSASSALSAAGLAMMLGLLIGVYIGLRLLILEVNYLNFTPSTSALQATGKESFGWKQNQPIFGLLVLIGVVSLAFVYDAYDYPVRGGFLAFGLLIGIVMQRTRFCFVRAFREPFMTGDTEMTKAVILAVIICTIGFTILKWTDLRDPIEMVSLGFWFGSLVGGIIFGIGMSLSGGCATGCLWRAGEGQVKLWVAIVAFTFSTSLFRNWLDESGWLMKLGEEAFLPDIMGWKLAVATVIGVMLLWYLVIVWNEVKRKLVVGW
jgi:uncharacterized membrane protein YedE/YeeE